MPIYEYRCKDCHQVFEEWCKHIEEKSVRRSCPICKGQAERLISNTSFALKGGGWYTTEYGTHKNHAVADSAPGAASADAAQPAVPAGEKSAPVPAPGN